MPQTAPGTVSNLLMQAWVKPLVFLLALLPAGYLVWAIAADALGANPAQALVRATGDWTLRMLCLVLALTPARVLLGWPVLARFRRMLGLFVFFYASLHLLCYAWFDMEFVLADIARDVLKRPFIWLGFSGFVILAALAATSPHAMVRSLGAKNWRRLHRGVYGAALLAVLHFYWMRAGKNDVGEVLVYAAVLAMLLGWRLKRAFSQGG
jgi:sulfoxide reductase heme-binding subunit YedZ